jgi:thioredoxin reductase (NADPH)
MYDIAVIGKGPAGISAAINSAARNKKVIVFGRDSKKVFLSPLISNYPGIIEVKGSELVEKFKNHINHSGVEISEKQVTAVYAMGDYFTVQAEKDMIDASAVIIAVGVDFKKTIEGEDIFLGNGVSYCATCDAPLYKGKITAVIGYNQESIEETKFLSEICSKVYFIPLIKNDFDFKDNVEIVNDIPVTFKGSMKAEQLILKNSTITADGFFIIKDSYPLTTLVPGLEVEGPHVLVNRNMETNIKGLYAAGDVAGKPYQIVKAAGEGQVAALNAAEYIDTLSK